MAAIGVSVHLAVATGHLSSLLLFFPDQVTYPRRIRPRLSTLHSFLTSFLFSIPGGSWTVSSLACKCICAPSIQCSMSVWIFPFLLAFLSIPHVVREHAPSPDLVDPLLTGAQVAGFFLLNGGKNRMYSFSFFFFPSCFFPLPTQPPFWNFTLPQI